MRYCRAMRRDDNLDDSRPEYRLIRELRALTVELDLFGAQFAKSEGLHATDLRALIVLLEAERDDQAVTPAVLGRTLGGLNSATVTAILDRLERRGMVVRTPDRDDRRRVLVEVTEHAGTVGRGFFGPLIVPAVEALKDYGQADLRLIERFLDDMTRIVTDVRKK